MGMAKPGHDENGHRLCCVRPAAKLTVRAKARNAFVSRRLAGPTQNPPQVAASRPNPTTPTKAIVLTMLVFTRVLLITGVARLPVVWTRPGSTNSTQKIEGVPAPPHPGNRPECNPAPSGSESLFDDGRAAVPAAASTGRTKSRSEERRVGKSVEAGTG